MTDSPYDDIARWYDAAVRSGKLPGNSVLPHLLDCVGDVRGLRICDLACGQGTVARELARQGASVVAVDTSSELLKIARRNEEAEPLGITYLLDDAQVLSKLEDHTFDGVVSHMGLTDIPDLGATFRAVSRVLGSQGWFVFSITHPCFEAPHATWNKKADGIVSREIYGYFGEGFWRSENTEGVRGQVGAYHRMISTYVNAVTEAGFSMERLVEPQLTGPAVDRVPGYAVVPAFILVRCKKP